MNMLVLNRALWSQESTSSTTAVGWKVCEMENLVLFGAGGGYIFNIATGSATPFYKRDGVYVFTLWIPPLAEAVSSWL